MIDEIPLRGSFFSDTCCNGVDVVMAVSYGVVLGGRGLVCEYGDVAIAS